MINNKVDFIFTIKVEGANPNGDPLAGNMPRIDSRGYGEISDVCLKRKIRNRMQDMGHEIFVKSENRSDDGFNSLEARFSSKFDNKSTNQEIEEKSCEYWLDVRSFGQVVTYLKKSVGIRGPVSISIAKSVEPAIITTMQITKSVNGQEMKDGKKSSDTIGSKHYIDYAVYVVNGSVNAYFAEKTGFDEKDLEVLKEAIRTLFINDVSSARPDGSMEVKDIYWINHSSKIGDVSSGKLKDMLIYDLDQEENKDKKYEDYNFRLDEEKLKEYEDLGISVEHFVGL
ncbi:type I-C CRISPR-associated protein Cas7/Csd2 [Anaerococcus sp. AGMB00486]|uniref:Type I-C CRISPR-associated protein Cas7/Csd2 n=2 Tax=Anaerococcus TaxID=165779 RepID=A0ABX2NCI0_9FIRM|nr:MULTISPECIES: type I-C CRISPR-associated protein Cas7/Csd2 [Anaerococcus]MSS78454.1 type I-C CRISPR-associated protein Cas7/Csd2 [Anaerococcus porci]NVF12427.1 type I-C CRISPR-associated protein Cas7/Csd2 [Anaerococcus faecalis]